MPSTHDSAAARIVHSKVTGMNAGQLCNGLPPMFIDVGDVDMFHDEDVEFAGRLKDAGVPVEFHVHPGSYHASEVFAPMAALSAKIWAVRIAAMQKALA